ncbi:MAG: putative lipid II flippase FtsW [Desulfamplus sp.]|nr:putative lipid II flippase FtsW [Desulfamplus sp.]MBF0209710.1 putative lipid II flippase FtsW [Desulfamplus sp.]MBF0242684.1 putative lipid II flippase FtsW [Desulfamplus sp.]
MIQTGKIKTYPFWGEPAILFPVIILAGLGIIMVHSASASISVTEHGSALYYVKKQFIFCAMGLVIMFVASLIPYKMLNHLAYFILFSAFLFLLAVQVPGLGIKAGGAYRWLNVAGFTFQPSEFAKLALIIFLAYSLSKKQEMISNFLVGFLPHVFILGLLAVLILIQPDLGTVVIMGAISWIMMFVAGVRIIHLLSPAPLLVPFIYFLVYKVEYRMARIFAYRNPWDDPLNTGYQITHSLKAFGSGGLFGKGMGMGMQKLHYLPEPHTDFILSIIGEELGLVGVLGILTLYTIVIIKGIGIAREADTLFGTFLATGITSSLALQVTINTGVTMGLLPTKGLTLPFLSYGGTSLIMNMAGMGILMSIAASKTK